MPMDVAVIFMSSSVIASCLYAIQILARTLEV